MYIYSKHQVNAHTYTHTHKHDSNDRKEAKKMEKIGFLQGKFIQFGNGVRFNICVEWLNYQDYESQHGHIARKRTIEI